jgi:Flp pilus assembly protein TadD
VVLVLSTAGVYWQTGGFGFINFDDPLYVTGNMRVLNGLSWQGTVWAFTTTKAASNWHPLTWLSLMLDCELFESKAQACHITNLLFHLANTLLLFVVLRQMTGALWRSGFVAALFALHPLHVESVAWVSGRKDVLSTFFWLLTMWAYVRYVRRRCFARYIAIVVFFVLGLMAKPMLVTLPFVLLILDYWPLGRLRLNEPHDKIATDGGAPAGNTPTTIAGLLWEKIPLFVLTAISCVVTYLVQQSGGAVRTMQWVGLGIRLPNAAVSYTNYIVKMFWPTRLAMYYPLAWTIPIWPVVLAGLFLAGISLLAIWWVRRRPYLLVGWLWYLGTLVPVIGLVQVGEQAMADRYTYVPLTGLFIALTWGVYALAANWASRRIVLGILTAVVLSALTVCTARQVAYWRDDITLYEHTLAVTKNNHVIHISLGLAWMQQDRLDKAVEHQRQALRVRPHDPSALTNLGMVFALQRRYTEAIKCYRQSLQSDSNRHATHNSLGAAILSIQGDPEEAAEHFRRALKLKPDYDNAHLNLATVLIMQGRFDEAIQQYHQVLQLNPNDRRAQQGLQTALMKKNKAGRQEQKNEKLKFEMVLPQ